MQALSAHENILLVAYDIDARGPLAAVALSKHLLSAALVVSPERGTNTLAAFELRLVTGDALTPSGARAENAALVAGNSTESCLPFMEAIARGGTHDVLTLATPTLGLDTRIEVF